MQHRNYDPAHGQAFQGDVAIIPVPAGIDISFAHEIKPVDGKLILQEGELTGHHHHIKLRERNFRQTAQQIDPVLNVRDTSLRKKFGGARTMKATELAKAIEQAPGAKMYRDLTAVQKMASMSVKASNGKMAPVLTRPDLFVGFLIIPNSEIVGHQEHDSIQLLGGDGSVVTPATGYPFQAGRYYVGGQIESAGAEERRVAD